MEFLIDLDLMSFPPPTSHLSPPGITAAAGEHFARDLTALVEDIERTRDWFNAQMEAQLASLHQLQAAMRADDSGQGTSMAALFETPPAAVTVVAPEKEPARMTPLPASSSAPTASPAKTIVLPPTMMSALNPQMEQATLQELNTALSRAFAEISSRGGMMA